MVRVGVGGWVFKPWRGRFYPEGLPQKEELGFMAGQFSTTEVNATFYRTPSVTTIEHWRDSVSPTFRFALKAPRYATNRRDLREAGESVARFLTSGIARLGPTLGPINWQLAPTKTFDAEEFDGFLALLPPETEGAELRHAVELRHDSFACAAAVEICAKHGVAIVCAGDSRYPLLAEATADFAYLRLMGTEESHPAGYAPKALDAWAERIRHWPGDLPRLGARGKMPEDTFVYVISGAKESNPDAAKELRDRLE